MGASMSNLQGLRTIADIVLTIVNEIRSSRIFENPTFADLRLARDSRPQRQARRAPTVGRRGEEWREDRIAIETEEEIREQEIEDLLAARAPRATRGNVQGFCSVQTDEVGIHASEEIPRRRLYETPGRCAAVLQMKTKEAGVSTTTSNDEGKKVFVVHLHVGSTRQCSRWSNN